MDWRERELVEAVKRLAAPPDEQRAHLRSLDTSPSLDELGLEFDDVSGLQGGVTTSTPWGMALNELSAALSAISGPDHAELWTVDALDGREWAEIRALARRAIEQRPR
jgi:hypothetical protein